LKSGKEQEVTLKEELEFLEGYLQIQQTLLEERLRVSWEIDPRTLDCLIPNMMLQPLVENSIRHGLANRAGGGQIAIKAWNTNGALHLEVCDDGVGLNSRSKETTRNGVGLANVRARLEHRYGHSQNFALQETFAGGLTVSITVPFREVDKQAGEDSNDHRG
jgi:sensor histidine kinase YesM